MLSKLFIITLVLCAGALHPAHAQEVGSSQDDPAPSGAYGRILLQGGMMIPLQGMDATYQDSLAGSGRLGWTSRAGLGIDVTIDYSPLSRRPGQSEESYETHFLTANLMPRFTLGRGVVRLWLAAGGGVAYQRARPLSGDQAATNQHAATASAATGLELHFFSGLGLAAVASYARTYGQLDYELVNLTGGLALTF